MGGRVDPHRAQRVHFVAHDHRPEFGRERGSGAARHDDRRDEHRQFAHDGDADEVAHVDFRAEHSERQRRFEGEDEAEQEADEKRDGRRVRADAPEDRRESAQRPRARVRDRARDADREAAEEPHRFAEAAEVVGDAAAEAFEKARVGRGAAGRGGVRRFARGGDGARGAGVETVEVDAARGEEGKQRRGGVPLDRRFREVDPRQGFARTGPRGGVQRAPRRGGRCGAQRPVQYHPPPLPVDPEGGRRGGGGRTVRRQVVHGAGSSRRSRKASICSFGMPIARQ